MAKGRQQKDQPEDKPANVQYRRPAIQETFDQWFTRLVGSGQLTKGSKSAIRAHMKAYGFYDSGKYSEGLKHYGM